MQENGEVRFTARIPPDLVRRVESFASSTSISRNQALVELVRLGLDADTAGIETSLQIQAQIKRELQSLRGLVVAAIDSGDAATAAVLSHQVRAGLIEGDQISSNFISIRGILPKLKQLKKQSPASNAAADLLDGTTNE